MKLFTGRSINRDDVDVLVKDKLKEIHNTLNPSIMIEKLKRMKRDIISKNRRLMEGLDW